MVFATTQQNDKAAWLPGELDLASSTLDLAPFKQEIEAALTAVGAREMEEIDQSHVRLPTLAPLLAGVADDIEVGRGFVLLRGLPVTEWGPEKSKLALWCLGTHLGWAEPQDISGALVHDVKDRRPPSTDGSVKAAPTDKELYSSNNSVRGFQTNAALPYHTDGCDMFALMCLAQGRAGGNTSIVSAVHIFNKILETRPDVAKTLQSNFHFDARGQRSDGARCQVHPIFCQGPDGRMNLIHKEPYILSAQRFDDVPKLTAEQKEALKVLKDVMEGDGMALELSLEPGDTIVCSNHSLAHGRTAFEDDGAGGSQTRHLLRLWLTSKSTKARALPAHYANTRREYTHSYARRMGGALAAGPKPANGNGVHGGDDMTVGSPTTNARVRLQLTESVSRLKRRNSTLRLALVDRSVAEGLVLRYTIHYMPYSTAHHTLHTIHCTPYTV
jgi:alpha-ketoglutarate-dependent taurine dioxygenase